MPQSIPAGVLVTSPAPDPLLLTSSVTIERVRMSASTTAPEKRHQGPWAGFGVGARCAARTEYGILWVRARQR